MILDEPGKAEKKKKKLIILVFKLFTGRTNAYLVKRKAAGGVQFSRDPFNLTNENKRKYAGYSSSKAIGVQPTENSVVVLSKKPAAVNQPAKALIANEYRKTASKRQIYKGVAATAKNYRNDLIPAAVARASAISYAKAHKREPPAKSVRGGKAALQFGLESTEAAA
ncbi:60S ribosomal protein L28 [Ascosphaera apis ARSEF 7405]|uniref:60S ribosomal protein L28 n=1 Tax=Ascosphaera apis ARSEF 7405 TaxID=392613 RepID=A0A167VAY8_9EURO|nr:60S ribosomal protein L28 [Ascosphaera apis ARSEF 7405]